MVKEVDFLLTHHPIVLKACVSLEEDNDAQLGRALLINTTTKMKKIQNIRSYCISKERKKRW